MQHRNLFILSAISIIFVLLLIVPKAQPVTGGEWTSLTFDNNNTRYQANSTINSMNVGSLVPAWNITTHNSITSTPLVQNGNVYFDDWGGFIWSANVVTGKVNWRKYIGAAISSTPELYNGTLYVTYGPGSAADSGAVGINVAKNGNKTTVIALNAATGETYWANTLQTKMNAIWSSPIIYKGLVYVGVASSGDESQSTWKGAIFALNARTGVEAWNTSVAGPDGGAAVWSSVVVDPVLNEIYFGTGNAYSSPATKASNPANDIAAANELILNLSGSFSWISSQNSLIVSVTGNSVGTYSTSNVALAAPGSIETQTFTVTSNAALQTLTTTTGNFYNITQVSLDSPNNHGANPSLNGIVIEEYTSSFAPNTVNSINATTTLENSLYSYSIVSLDATSGQIVWYNQTCTLGLSACADADFGSTPNLFSFTNSITSITYNAVGIGGKDSNYYVFNRENGVLLEKFTNIGTSESQNFSDGGIIGIAGTTGTNNPEIFVPSFYYQSGTGIYGGIIQALNTSTGNKDWNFSTTGITDGSVAVIPGAILFGDAHFTSIGNGDLYAISTSGVQLFHSKLQNGMDSGVSVAEGHVFATGFLSPSKASSNTLGIYAFSLPPVLTISNIVADGGQPITLTAKISNSIKPDEYSFYFFNENGIQTNLVYGSNGICNGANVIITAQAAECTLDLGIGGFSPTFYTFGVGVTSGSNTFNSIPVSVAVYGDSNNTNSNSPTLKIAPTYAMPSTGQSETFSLKISGGVGPFSIALYNMTGNDQMGSNLIVQSPGGSNSITFTVGKSGLFRFDAIATDLGTTNPFVFNSSRSVISVNTLVANAPIANSTLISDGQKVNIAAQPSGGSPPYGYQWYNSTSSTAAWNNWNSTRDGILLDSMESGWSGFSPSSTEYADYAQGNYVEGNGSAALVTTNGNAKMIKYIQPTDLSSATNFYFWVLVPNSVLVKNGTTGIELDFARTTNLNNQFQCYFDGGMLRNGWNPLVINKSDCINVVNNVPSNAPASWAGINAIMFQVYPSINAPVFQVNFDNLRYNYNGGIFGKAVIMINFDDGYKNVSSTAYPILKAYNLTATAFILPGLLNNTPLNSNSPTCTGNVISNTAEAGCEDYMTVNDLNILYNGGWDIASHTWDHSGDPQGLLNNTIGQNVIFEIFNSTAWLKQNGFTRSARFFAYPDGAYNALIIQDVKNAGYVLAKYGSGDSVRQPNLYGGEPYNLTYTVKATDITNTVPVNTIESKINDAIAQKGLLIITFHQVFSNNEAERNVSAYNETQFTQVVSYIASQQKGGNVIVTNFSDYYSMLNHPIQNSGAASIAVSPASNTYYYYGVNDSTNAISYSQKIFITVNRTLSITNFTANKTSVNVGEPVGFRNTTVDGTGNNIFSYSILTGPTGGSMTSTGPNAFSFTSAGTYVVNLRVVDQSGETDNATATIAVASSATTTIPSGGGGSTGGGAGGGGGSSVPVVSYSNGCAIITNVAVPNSFSFTLDGKQVKATDNFIGSNYTSIIVDGSTYVLNLNGPSTINGLEFNLTRVSYLPIQHTVSFAVCQQSGKGVNHPNATTSIAINISTNPVKITVEPKNATQLISVSNTIPSVSPPANFTLLSAILLSVGNLTNSTTLAISMNFKCGLAGVSPYVLKDGTWKAITPFSYSNASASCAVKFTIPAKDPVLALMQRTSTQNSIAPQQQQVPKQSNVTTQPSPTVNAQRASNASNYLSQAKRDIIASVLVIAGLMALIGGIHATKLRKKMKKYAYKRRVKRKGYKHKAKGA
ncbi:MAG: polysaccharide deacetylase family protein [Candidatus Micrarchaeota archaeon]|nr:polysaccharide deacetylase family protein [Candidatus Micrarchaeota archaeon]